MKPSRRNMNSISIIPERKHARPAGTRLITRSTTVRPFVYNFPCSKDSQESTSTEPKRNEEILDEKYNATSSSLGANLANTTEISTKSLYHSTPKPKALGSPRKQKYINQTLLKSFNASPEVAGINVPEESDAQKELPQTPLYDLLMQEPVETGKFQRNSRTTTHKTQQKALTISTSVFGSCPSQKKLIRRKRKSSCYINITDSGKALQSICSRRISSRMTLNQSLNKSSPKSSPQDETIVTKRKNRSFTTISASDNIPQQISTRASETPLEIKIQSVRSLVTERHLADPIVMPSESNLNSENLTSESINLQKIPLTTTTTTTTTVLVENNKNQELSSLHKIESDSAQDELIRMTEEPSVKTSDITVQQNHPINNTSIPIEQKSGSELKNLVWISSTKPYQVSPKAFEESYLFQEANAINTDNSLIQRSKKATTSQENICRTSHELLYHQDIKLMECNVVLQKLQFQYLKHLIKEGTNKTSDETKQDDQMSNYDEYSVVESEHSRSKKQEENVTDRVCSINIEKNNEQEQVPLVTSAILTTPTTSFSHASLENNTSQLKNQSEYAEENNILIKTISDTLPHSLSEQHKTLLYSTNTNKDTENELLLVSSVTHVPSENSTSLVKNQSKYTQINDVLSKKTYDISNQSLNEQHKSSKPGESVTSEISIQPENFLSISLDAEHLTLKQTGPLLFQGKELKHPSSQHLIYNPVVSSVGQVNSNQSRKSKRKTKPESSKSQAPKKCPLFEEYKKIKFWTGRVGKRSISDLSDLDIALNVMDEIIEEICEEDQRKQEILHNIQEKYHNSLHEMINTVQNIKKKKKEVKEMMTAVKELADEVDQVVDHKIRLRSKLLALKAQRKTTNTASGPTWEDFNDL